MRNSFKSVNQFACRFISHNSRKIVVVRDNLTHDGHDPSSIDERRVSKLAPELVSFIEKKHVEGKKPWLILNELDKWTEKRGHHDAEDRRFYATPDDISNIIAAYKARHRYCRIL